MDRFKALRKYRCRLPDGDTLECSPQELPEWAGAADLIEICFLEVRETHVDADGDTWERTA